MSPLYKDINSYPQKTKSHKLISTLKKKTDRHRDDKNLLYVHLSVWSVQNFRNMTVMDFVDYPKQKQVVTPTAAVISAWYVYRSKLGLPWDHIFAVDLAKAFFSM